MRTLSLVVISLSVLLGAGCKKEEKKANPAADTAAKPADPAAAPAGSAAPAAAAPAAPAAPAAAAPAAAAPATPGSPEEAKAVDLMMKMGKVFEGAGTDCKKLATDLNAFGAANKAAMADMKKWEATQTPEQKKAMEEKYRPQMEQMMKAMMPVMQACAQDKDVEAAFKSLDLG